MNATEAIAHVEESIARSLRGESWIDASVLDIKGFSTATQRRLMSNLAHLPKENRVYLEVGLFCGATFCAAINNNPNLEAYGFEDWSQPFGEEGVKEQFTKALKQHASGSVCIREGDCFGGVPQMTVGTQGVDLFYFDGEHSFESQAEALPHFFDMLADTFIFVVDDFSWQPVCSGTAAGFASVARRIQIEHQWILSDGIPDGPNWHNDVALYVITRRV